LARVGRAGLAEPVFGEALAGGGVAVSTGAAILRAGNRLEDPADRREVLALGVRLAGANQTRPRVQDACERLAAKLDPRGFSGGHEAAYKERSVRYRPRAAAMGLLTVYGSAAELAAVLDKADALAMKIRPDDPRTADQRRHDAFIEAFAGLAGLAGPGGPGGPGGLGGAGGPGGPGGRDGLGGAGASDRAGGVSGAGGPYGTGGQAGSGGPDGTGGSGGSRGPGGGAGRGRSRYQVLVRMDATTLLGLDGKPGLILGVGPVPAEVGRKIAADATWRALFTDPATGRPVWTSENSFKAGLLLMPKAETGPPANPWGEPAAWPTETAANDSYRPGVRLRRLLAVRQARCANPACGQPARRCEVDHIDPFDSARPASEQTITHNMQHLCKACHDLKTSHGWEYERDPQTGATTITTPNGHTHRIPADALD
jgi:hypothetical protein